MHGESKPVWGAQGGSLTSEVPAAHESGLGFVPRHTPAAVLGVVKIHASSLRATEPRGAKKVQGFNHSSHFSSVVSRSSSSSESGMSFGSDNKTKHDINCTVVILQ